ncbi:hypothetical protein MMC26_006142 [Xylographa opegraphella]|nr:hypothetical protein [Xylographa opegraphella]
MAATTSMRQSCHRCHGQKLRCTSDTGACSRCIGQGLQCVYSYSLPKGRPSQPRQAGAADQTLPANRKYPPLKRPAATPASAEGRQPISVQRRNAPNAAVATTKAAGSPPHVPTRIDDSTDGSGDPGLVEAMPLMASTWPWPGPTGWSDLQLEGNEQVQDLNEWVASIHHQNNALVDLFPNQNTSFLDQTTIAREECKGNQNMGRSSQHTLGLAQKLSADSDVLEVSSSHSGTYNVNALAGDAKDPSAGIAQLTQLSTRLYTLHRLSCALVGAAKSPPSTLCSGDLPSQAKQDLAVDRGVFGLLMTRLFQAYSDKTFLTRAPEVSEPPNIHDTIQDALSASYRLREILGGLQTKHQASTGSSGRYSPQTPVPTPKGPGSSSLPFSVFSEPMQAEQDNVLSRTESQSSDTVVRHLAMACHGMLLSIYTAVLGVLQQDADSLSSASCFQGPDTGPNAKVVKDNDPLIDARLVVIVQLCSYLIKRQQQAVDAYLSPRESPTSAVEGLATPTTASPPTDLEVKLQERLTRLHQTLRI